MLTGCLLYLVYDIIDFEITENSSCTFVGLISFCFVFKLVRIVFFLTLCMFDSAVKKIGFELNFFGYEEVECKLIYFLDTFTVIFTIKFAFEGVKCLPLLRAI